MKKIFLLLIVVFIAGYFIWQHEISPKDANNKTQQMFVVQKGEGIRAIGKDLKNQGLIRNDIVFYLLVKQQGIENKIQAGDFKLSPSLSTLQIAQTLTHGALDIWVTIPDGKRAEEVASILQIKLPEYQESWTQQLTVNEGYLFPDTYLFPRDASIDTVLSIIKHNFDQKYASLTITNTTMTQEQIIILASLIEREGKPSVDPQIASVFLNRLAAGMPLQVDATVQYALGYNPSEQTWWKKDLTTDDLTFASPYNTYIHTGLPPGPIANPGIDALQAAANPTHTDYLFYIADKHGQTHFAKTLAEQNANIKKYGL